MAAIRYLVNDVDAAVAFYQDRLGFTLQRQFGPAMAIVTQDDLTSARRTGRLGVPTDAGRSSPRTRWLEPPRACGR